MPKQELLFNFYEMDDRRRHWCSRKINQFKKTRIIQTRSLFDAALSLLPGCSFTTSINVLLESCLSRHPRGVRRLLSATARIMRSWVPNLRGALVMSASFTFLLSGAGRDIVTADLSPKQSYVDQRFRQIYFLFITITLPTPKNAVPVIHWTPHHEDIWGSEQFHAIF
jgi:hypothetical protein